MYAIIDRDGKQYKVKTGDIILFDKMDKESKDKIEFTNVLAIIDSENTTIGNPYLKNTKIQAEVINNGRAKKIIIFKKRRRKDSRLKKGFRRDFTRARITNIQVS